MTRANAKPLRRLVEGGRFGPLVLSVTSDVCTLRVRRSRFSVSATWAQLYQWTAEALADALRREKKNRRRVRRGAL